MSNGKWVYRVTILNNQHLGPMGLEASVIRTRVHETHRLAMAWAKEQQDIHCSRSYRYYEIRGSGLTDLGPIGIEVQRERIHQ